MWNSFRNWYIHNQDQITWFIIGWLSFAGIDALAEGRYIWAVVDFFLAYVNYKLIKIRL
jgi:hypothetical protein